MANNEILDDTPADFERDPETGVSYSKVPTEALVGLAGAVGALKGARMLACDLSESTRDPRLQALAFAIDHALEDIEPLQKYA